MTSVSGLLKIGEAQATLQSIGRRQRGSQFIFVLVLLALMVAGIFLGTVIAPIIDRFLGGAKTPDDWWSGAVRGGAFGMAGAALVYRFVVGKRMLLGRFRKLLIEKGSPPELSLCMETTTEALHYDVGELKHIAKWSCVSEVFSNHGYWIFLAQSSPFFAPKRFFADTDAERAFIKDALAHMSEAARARSKDAVAFAEAK